MAVRRLRQQLENFIPPGLRPLPACGERIMDRKTSRRDRARVRSDPLLPFLHIPLPAGLGKNCYTDAFMEVLVLLIVRF